MSRFLHLQIEFYQAWRHSGNAHGHVCKYETRWDLLTLKHDDREGGGVDKRREGISIKIPDPYSGSISRYAWNIQKQNDYSLKSGSRKYGMGARDENNEEEEEDRREIKAWI